MPFKSPYILLPIQLVVGGGIAIMLLEWTKLDEYRELKQIARPIINKVIRKHE